MNILGNLVDFFIGDKLEKALSLETELKLNRKTAIQLKSNYDETKSLFNHNLSEIGSQIELCKSEFQVSSLRSIKGRIEAKKNNLEREFAKSIVELTTRNSRLMKSLDSLTCDPEIQKAISEKEEKDKYGEAYETILAAYQQNKLDKETFKNKRKEVESKLGSKVAYSDMIIQDPLGRILLLKRAVSSDMFAEKWSLPGGHVDPNEEHKAAAIRECDEESGIVVDQSVSKVAELDNSKAHIEYYRTYSPTFPIVIINTREHSDYEWVLPEDLENYDLIGDLYETIRKVYPQQDNEVIAINKAFITVVEGYCNNQLNQETLLKYTATYFEKSEKQGSDKVDFVMGEFKDGRLKDGNGNVITDRKQAVAIALSEAGFSKGEEEIDEEEDSEVKKSIITIIKALETGKLQFDLIKAQVHKYIRREGSKGNYKYIYEESKQETLKGEEMPEILESKLEEIKGNLIKYKDDTELGSKVKEVLSKLNDGEIKEAIVKFRESELHYQLGNTYDSLKRFYADLDIHNKYGLDWGTIPGKYEVWRSGEVGGQKNGIFFSINKGGAEAYGDNNSEGRSVNKYEVNIQNPLVVKRAEYAYSILSGKSMQSILSERDKSKDVGNWWIDLDKKVAKLAKGRGYDSITYTAPAPPAIRELVLLDPSSVTKKDDDVKKSLDLLESAYEQGLISFEILEKARTGVYQDNSQNRSLKRVGKKYSKDKQGDEPTEDKTPKEEDTNKDTQSEKPIHEHAKQASGSALEIAAKEATDPEVRTAAHQELDRRSKEEAVQPEEEKKDGEVKNEPKKEKKNLLDVKDKIEDLSDKYKDLVKQSLSDDFSDPKKTESVADQQKEFSRYIQKIKQFENTDIDEETKKVNELLGLKSIEDIQKYFGDGKVIAMKVDGESVRLVCEDAYIDRSFVDGDTVEMHEFILNPELDKSMGKGSDIFNNQVKNFKDSGFTELSTGAARGPGYNGYYTWARLGYDFATSNYKTKFDSIIKESKDKDIQSVESLPELMSFQKGRDFWKENGFEFLGTFDLAEDSKSNFILNKYMEEKKNARK